MLPTEATSGRLGTVAATLEAIKEELRPLVHQLVLDLAREEIAHLANGQLGPDARVNGKATQSPSNAPRGVGKASDLPPTSERRRTKICSRCGETKPLRHFTKGRAQCRECRADYNRELSARRKRSAASANGSAEKEEPGIPTAPSA
jgi:hypothetical protein